MKRKYWYDQKTFVFMIKKKKEKKKRIVLNIEKNIVMLFLII